MLSGRGAGKSLEKVKGSTGNTKNKKRTNESKVPKEKASKFPGALFKQKERLMGRDRKGQWKLCEIMELRNCYVEPKPELEDEEEKNEDAFAKFSEPSKRQNMGPPDEKDEEFGAWLHWWVSPLHPGQNGDHPYEYYVTYVGLNRNQNRWVPHYFLKKDKESVQKEEALQVIQQQEKDLEKDVCVMKFPYFPNNIHHETWDRNEIDQFMDRTRMKTVEFIQYGTNKLIETHYHSPFPDEYHVRILYICHYCLHFFAQK